MMAHKALKDKNLSTSEAAVVRLASVLCTENDGDKYLLEVEKKLSLIPGRHTALYAERVDNKRIVLARNDTEKSLRKKTERTEGTGYKSNCEFEEFSEKVDDPHLDGQFMNDTLHDCLTSEDHCELVYFDLETSGFKKHAEILQIAARCKQGTFTVYCNPTQSVSIDASAVTGLANNNGHLFLHGKKVESIPLEDALRSFLQFLNLSPKSCILVAHNAGFDKRFLLPALRKYGMTSDFEKIVHGFVDTLPLFKEFFPDRQGKGEGPFQLSKLANDFLSLEGNFHEGAYDVEVLEQLSTRLIPQKNLFLSCEPFKCALIHSIRLQNSIRVRKSLSPLKGVISAGMIQKIAMAGINFKKLKDAHESDGDNGIVQLLSEKLNNDKPTVTKNKKILNNIVQFMKNQFDYIEPI